MSGVVSLGPFEHHIGPAGVEVYYRDADHSYWSAVAERRGRWSGSGRLTGVSTVVGPFDWRPDNLMRWAARTNGDGIVALASLGLSLDDADDMRTELAWLESGDRIWQALDDAELTYAHTRDEAAGRGTNVHKHGLEALASGLPVTRRDELTDEERGYSDGVVDFWLDADPRPEHSELVVADPALGVAGRLDLIATLHGTCHGRRFRGERALIDAKTSGFIPVKHHVQLAGYEHCAAVSGFGDVDLRLILQVAADGSYELIEGTAGPEDFAAAVDVYRRAARVQRESNAARKAEALPA